MDTDNNNVIPPEVFWKRKVEWFISMWIYGKDSKAQLVTNLVRMGYPEEDVMEYLETYENDPE